jgi:hypothetical protein
VRLGTLVAAKHDGVITVGWSRGPLDRVRQALESVQHRLAANPGGGLPPVTDGNLYDFVTPDGRHLDRIGGPGDPWLSVTDQSLAPGSDPGFRLGAPKAETTGNPDDAIQYFLGTLLPAPDIAAGQKWIAVTPAAPGRSAVAAPADDPHNADTVRVTTPDGLTSTIHKVGDQLVVPADDPMLGPNGSTEGAVLLRDFPAAAKAMREAAQTNDGFLRGVLLGNDAVVLAAADHVVLIPRDHPWTDRVWQAANAVPAGQFPLLQIADDRYLLIGSTDELAAEGQPRTMTLGEAQAMSGATPYLHEHFRSTLSFADGPVITSSLPSDTKVTVAEMTLVHASQQASQQVQADVLSHGGGSGGGGHWTRINIIRQPSTTTATPTTTPAPTSTTNVSASSTPSGKILLICPDTPEMRTGCGRN